MLDRWFQPSLLKAATLCGLAFSLTGLFPAAAEEAKGSKDTVEGTVRGPEGLDLATVAIFARPSDLEKVLATRCDAQGRFRLEVEGKPPFLVRAEAPAVAPAVKSGINPGEPVEFSLIPGFSLEGRVFFKDSGRPAAGAEVRALPEEGAAFADPADPDRFRFRTLTSDQGKFRFDHLPAAAHAVEVRAPGFQPVVTPTRWVGPGAAGDPLTISLSPGVELKGSVVDGSGKPVAKAAVSVSPARHSIEKALAWEQGAGHTASTLADGKFLLHAPPPGPFTLRAEKEGFAPTWIEGVEGGNRGAVEGLKIVLGPGAALRARLLDEGRNPFRGEVALTAACSGSRDPQNPRTVRRTLSTDQQAGGAALFEHLPVCTAKVTLEPSGFAPVVRGGVELAAEPADLGEIVLAVGQALTGKVLDAGGAPVAQADVGAMGFSLGQVDNKRTRTDKDGAFRLAGLSPDLEYNLQVDHKSFGPFRQAGLKAGAAALEIRLPRGGTIKGRVRAGTPPLPVTDFEVTAGALAKEAANPFMQFMNQDRRLDVRNAAGEFSIGQLGPGSFTLRVNAPGFLPARVENLQLEEGGEIALPDIVLEKGAALAGLVVDRQTRAPVPAASVVLEEAGLFNPQAIMRQLKGGLETGPEGRFRLAGLAPGQHTLKVQADQYAPAKVPFQVEAGREPEELTVELGPGGTIEGLVRDLAGQPVAGAMVIGMAGLMPDARTMASTDDLGRYRLERLTPGSYRVMAMPLPGAGEEEAKPSDLLGKMQMAMAEVTEGRVTTVNFPKEQGVRVTGTVRRGRTPLETKMFWVPSAGGKPAGENFVASSSDPTGRYEVRLPLAGAYQVSLLQEQQGQSTPKANTMDITIPANQSEVSQDLVIPESRLAGRVIREGDGQPVSGANVVVFRENTEGQVSVEGAVGSAPSGEDGRFVLDGLAKGTYQVVAGKPGFAPATLSGIKLGDDAQVEDLTCALPPAHPLTVKVTDDLGIPVEGALVFGMDNPGMLAAGVAGASSADGLLHLNQLGEGRHILVGVARGFAPTWLREIELPVPAGAEAVLRLERGGALKVRVVTSGNTPVAGASLAVSAEDGTDLTFLFRLVSMMEGQNLATGPDGWLTIPGVGNDPLFLTAVSGERRGQGKGTVKAGETAEVTIRLP